MVLLSLILLQAAAVERLESDDVEIREAARLELLALGGKALPALWASSTLEARGVIDRILDAAERELRAGRDTVFLGEIESARWTRELEALFPRARLRAAHVTCMHRNYCRHGGLWIYGISLDDASVFTIRRGSGLDPAFIPHLAPVPGREAETARTLQGGLSTQKLVFDAAGRLIRID